MNLAALRERALKSGRELPGVLRAAATAAGRVRRRVRRSVRDAWRNSVRSPSEVTGAVLSSAVALAMCGAALLANSQVSLAKSYWYDKVEVSVFFCTADSPAPPCAQDATDAQLRAAQRRLAAMADVDKVYLETREQAWEQFRERYRGSAILDGVTMDAMPQSLRVKLTDPARRAVVIDAAAELSGVEYVQDQKKMLAGFFNVLDMVKLAAAFVAVVQSVVAAMLVAATVRSSVAKRHDEVTIMRLVGAESSTVRAPFVLESVVVGVLGALLATAALAATRWLLIGPRVDADSGIRLVGGTQLAATAWQLLALGVLSGWAVSRITLRRALRA